MPAVLAKTDKPSLIIYSAYFVYKSEKKGKKCETSIRTILFRFLFISTIRLKLCSLSLRRRRVITQFNE